MLQWPLSAGMRKICGIRHSALSSNRRANFRRKKARSTNCVPADIAEVATLEENILSAPKDVDEILAAQDERT